MCYSREIHLHGTYCNVNSTPILAFHFSPKNSTECRITRVDGPETCSDTSVVTPSSFVKGNLMFTIVKMCNISTDRGCHDISSGRSTSGHG